MTEKKKNNIISSEELERMFNTSGNIMYTFLKHYAIELTNYIDFLETKLLKDDNEKDETN